MIPAAFAYHRAATVEEALALLAEHGDDAKVLAGGHSLLPLMKLRLVSPAAVVDIGPCRSELSFVRDDGDTLAVGALTCHRDVAVSPVVNAHAPILACAAGLVGDPQVRRRGTLGGSLAHGDPAGDLPGVALALGATLVVRGPEGERLIAATKFFTGFRQTALQSGEVVTEVRFPKVGVAGWSYQRFTRRAHEWPMVAVAAVRHPACGVALVNMGPTPLRSPAMEAALAGGATAAEAAERAAEDCEAPTDINASREYRGHLARILARRALEAAGPERAGLGRSRRRSP